MKDPLEGISEGGLITTGAAPDRVPPPFAPVVAAVVGDVQGADERATLYLYGSVATGQARIGRSDIDFLTIDLAESTAAAIATRRSEQFRSVCRSVEIAAARRVDLDPDTDEAYGLRVFLHHYCVHLTGLPRHRDDDGYPADRAAARGFNGDVARHAAAWQDELETGGDPVSIARRLARKSLLAVAGLVSVHDHTWTTDRSTAARRWAEIDPTQTSGLATLLRWIDGNDRPSGDDVRGALDRTVAPIVARFQQDIGLWP